MRSRIIGTVVFVAALAVTAAPVFAADAKAPPKAPAAAPAAAVAEHYTVAETDIGTILDDPAARAVVDKYIPEFSKGEQIDMARSMTLAGLQPFASDKITDKVLAQIDADFAKLPPKKK